MKLYLNYNLTELLKGNVLYLTLSVQYDYETKNERQKDNNFLESRSVTAYVHYSKVSCILTPCKLAPSLFVFSYLCLAICFSFCVIGFLCIGIFLSLYLT